ncbi:MAG TPA: hypothetical protein EYQ63_14875, partial [Fuerstia sp.]|nr:hypothetical protein [Fuerstiella sp.]
MLTLCILGVGLTIVIGGILGLRLHAFIALVLAGMAVALLTPTRLVERSAVLEAAIAVESISADGVIRIAGETEVTDAVLLLDNGRDGSMTNPASVVLLPDGQLHVVFTADGVSETASLPPADELIMISRADYESAQKLAGSTFVSRITSTIGEYCGKLAILIVAASIIGRCLLDSGAASRIVNSTLSLLGERMAPAAFVFSGFTLGIPVFFDTVFYLMIPLGKALRLRTGGNYLLYVLAIVAGGTMAHSLVPPTPGPLFIAEEFGVPIESMILGGCIVGLFSASVGMVYAFWINGRCELPLRDIEEVAAAANSSDDNAPGLFASLVPIVLPVVLILTLVFSMIEAFMILPNHLSHSLSAHETTDRKKRGDRLRARVNDGAMWLRDRVVGPIVDAAVEWRYLTVGVAIMMLLVSLSMIAGGTLKFRAFPDLDGDVIEARLLMPQGTPLRQTRDVVKRLTDALARVDKEFSPGHPENRKLI